MTEEPTPIVFPATLLWPFDQWHEIIGTPFEVMARGADEAGRIWMRRKPGVSDESDPV